MHVRYNASPTITKEFGFVGDGETNNDDAWDDMFDAIDGENVVTTFSVPPGHYKFSSPVTDIARSGIHMVRLIGVSGQPMFDQTPSALAPMRAVFEYDNASASVFLDIDPGTGTLQSGVYLENIDFWNTGHVNNKAISIDRTNNWRLRELGFQGWHRAFVSESNNDNAHGAIYDCMVNIPAGKAAYEFIGGAASPGAGCSIRGGSLSGDTDSVGIIGGPWAGGLRLWDFKIDGTTHGGVVYAGSGLLVNGTEFERCSDSTHPAIDITHDAARGDSGRGNIIAQANITGRVEGTDLSGRFGTGTFSCAVSSMVYMEQVAGGWVDNGTYNIVQPQLFAMPSSASYPPQLTDGSTLAQTIDKLQQAQLVSP